MSFLSRKLLIVLLAAACASGLGTAPSVSRAADSPEHATDHATISYTCPMHPQVVSDKPGNCPICGMRLVRRDVLESHPASKVEGYTPVSLSEPQRKELGIRTALVEEKALAKTVHAWGVVAHDPELYQLQVEFIQASRLEKDTERQPTYYWQRQGLTTKQKLEIKLKDMGLTEEWIRSLGKSSVPDRRLLFHHEGGEAWVYLELAEQDAGLVHPGDPVTVQASALPGIRLEGRVEFIDEMVMESRTVRARALVKDAALGLKPNVAVQASIRADLGTALAVPEGAPLFAGEKTLVFVDRDGVFEPREVILGRKADGYYEVKQGLAKGETVSVDGNFFIDSESRLRSAFSAGHEHEGHRA